MMLLLYPWIKSFHIIAVISWMAALLYLPRLFVYHAEVPLESARSHLLKKMEYRLSHIIMTPAMILTLLSGGMLSGTPGLIDWHQGWIYVKLVCVVTMLGFHGCLTIWRRGFAADKNFYSQRFYRLVNEFPTLLMIIIVIMATVKPF